MMVGILGMWLLWVVLPLLLLLWLWLAMMLLSWMRRLLLLLLLTMMSYLTVLGMIRIMIACEYEQYR